MADSSPEPLLHAFGIRDLNGPKAPPGVVQISSNQYDATVQSQPDALLSYVDDDDGETITVGTSFELGQRLDEPARHSTLTSPSRGGEPDEFKKMHIFDIQHTNRSLAIWKDHERHTSGRLKSGDGSYAGPGNTSQDGYVLFPLNILATKPKVNNMLPGPSDSNSTATSKDITADHSNSDTAAPAGPSCSPGLSKDGDFSAQLDKVAMDMFGCVESQLGPLANFLDMTADGLRKLAETTAKSDSTAMKDVLSGFKGILTEVGGIGLGFVAILNEAIEKGASEQVSTGPISSSASANNPVSSIPAPELKESPAQPKSEASAKRVSFAEAPSSAVPPKPEQPQGLRRESGKGPGPLYLRIPGGSKLPYLPSETSAQAPSTVGRTLGLEPARKSILDMDHGDPDFSARYPSLMTLRKAKSVGGLHERSQLAIPRQSSASTNSALSRYPSIGQLEQLARAGLRIRPKKVPTTTFSSDMKLEKIEVGKKPATMDERSPVEFKLVPEQSTEPDTKTVANAIEETAKESWPLASLPGAWPDPKTEDWTSALPTTQTSNRGTTVTRPPPPAVSTRAWSPDGLLHRVDRPNNDTFFGNPLFPRRHPTVSGTNLAARLNGPFDPLGHIPVLQPRPQRSQPDLSRFNATPENVTDRQSNLADALPQRSQTLHSTDRYKPQPPTAFNFSSPARWDKYLSYGPAKETSYDFSGVVRKSPGDGVRYGVPPPTGLEDKLAGGQSPISRTDEHVPPVSIPGDYVKSARLTANAPDYTEHLRHPLFPRMYPDPPPAGPSIQFPTLRPSTIAARHVPRPPMSTVITPTPVARRSGRMGAAAPPPVSTSSVDECVKILKTMGYGTSDPNEMERLNIYAGAAAGNIEEAIEMIEEDRAAVGELEDSKDIEGFKDLEHDANGGAVQI